MKMEEPASNNKPSGSNSDPVRHCDNEDSRIPKGNFSGFSVSNGGRSSAPTVKSSQMIKSAHKDDEIKECHQDKDSELCTRIKDASHAEKIIISSTSTKRGIASHVHDGECASLVNGAVISSQKSLTATSTTTSFSSSISNINFYAVKDVKEIGSSGESYHHLGSSHSQLSSRLQQHHQHIIPTIYIYNEQEKEQDDRPDHFQMKDFLKDAQRVFLLAGACMAVSMVFLALTNSSTLYTSRNNCEAGRHNQCYSNSPRSFIRKLHHSVLDIRRRPYSVDGSLHYSYLFGKPMRKEEDKEAEDALEQELAAAMKSAAAATTAKRTGGRELYESGGGSFWGGNTDTGSKLVIAGKIIVEDSPCNIGQMSLATKKWSTAERIQLSLYNSYSGGEVFSLLANHTKAKSSEISYKKSTTSSLHTGSGELIVVGAFDTTYRNSQVTYCSVGKWDGAVLSKVGEGLCNSALSKGMKITCASMAGPQDVYVAGAFQTQVWNGDRHAFVKIYNIAHFNAADQVWLPLHIGQITCSWCTVTVLALAWDSKREQLHVAGKFNSIDGRNIPAALAIYDRPSGRLVAHPGGGLTMRNKTEDGVGTALQLDEESSVLYVMGSFQRLTALEGICKGLAAYEIIANRWTCLADREHTVVPTGGGNMLLSPYGLMVAGKVTSDTTWHHTNRPYTIALLKTSVKKKETKKISSRTSTKQKISLDDDDDDDDLFQDPEAEYLPTHAFHWSWLPGFDGHDEPLHALSNGFGEHEGTVFIAGDNLVARWSYVEIRETHTDGRSTTSTSSSSQQTELVAVTEVFNNERVRGAIMAISQMNSEEDKEETPPQNSTIGYTLIVYCVAFGALIGMFLAVMCNKNLTATVLSVFKRDAQLKGISLDTLTYGAAEHPSITDAYQRAMRTRYVQHPHLLTLIDPQEIFLQRIIGEGTFGRVWSANWKSSKVAVKEFVFAQAAVAGKSSQQQQIIEEIIGEAGMMAILRHPNVLQLFGCSLTAQAIWIVSELCSLGSLRQLLDDNEKTLPVKLRLQLALQVAEGMCYLHNQEPPIIHRDLKSHNIFVHETFTEKSNSFPTKKKKKSGKNTSDVSESDSIRSQKMVTESTIVAKIGDWGSARATLSGSRTMTHGVGTACWLAPEVIKHARSSKYSDVYGYGIALWELATREEVYQGLETTQIIAKVANESLRPPVPKDCPWKDLMVKCWEENPLDRLSFDDVVKELDKLLKICEAENHVTYGPTTVESEGSIPTEEEINRASYQNS